MILKFSPGGGTFVVGFGQIYFFKLRKCFFISSLIRCFVCFKSSFWVLLLKIQHYWDAHVLYNPIALESLLWISKVKSSLHSQDQPILVMRYLHSTLTFTLYKRLDSTCGCFVEDFSSFTSEISCSLVRPISGFDLSVFQPHRVRMSGSSGDDSGMELSLWGAIDPYTSS